MDSALAKIIIPFFAFVLMGILLDIRVKDIFTKNRPWTVPFITFIIVINGIILIIFGQGNVAKINILSREIPLFLITMHLPVILFFALISKYKRLKLAFVYLTAFIFSSLPLMSVRIINSYILELWPVAELICYIVVCLVILVAVYYVFKPKFFYMLENVTNREFFSFCVIPLVCIIYIAVISKYNFFLQNTQAPLLIQLPIFICITAYYLLLIIFKRTREMELLQMEKNMLYVLMNSSGLQVEEMRRTQEKTVLMQHDLHHHLAMVTGFMRESDLGKIKEYLANADIELDKATPQKFSKNETVNLILSSFYAKAKKENVELIVYTDLPEKLSIPETELCALLSNGLENAIKATSKVDESRRKIKINCSINKENLLIFIENSVLEKVQIKSGIPVTTEKGHGYGAKSIVTITEMHSGYYIFESTDEMFYLRIVLPLN